MKSFPVVKYLNVLEDIKPCFFSGTVFTAAVDPLALHGPEASMGALSQQLPFLPWIRLSRCARVFLDLAKIPFRRNEG